MFKSAEQRVTGYHAHVYYDSGSKSAAEALRETIASVFDVPLGRMHDHPVGPHPMGSYQITFAPALYGELVQWLSLNRNGLTIFIHPETGDDVLDHTEHAVWMGSMPVLNLGALTSTPD